MDAGRWRYRHTGLGPFVLAYFAVLVVASAFSALSAFVGNRAFHLGP